MARKKSFEENLNRFGEIIAKIENSETGLEEAVVLYKEGVTLAAELSKVIEKAETEITMLTQKLNGEAEEQPFK